MLTLCAMSTAFRQIALFGKPNPLISDTLTIIYRYLISNGYSVLIENDIAPFLPADHSAQSMTLNDLPAHSELAIAIGGDGTFFICCTYFFKASDSFDWNQYGALGFSG